MKTAVGNQKLGSQCLVVSRPVGKTCPIDCYFLGNGCYAEFTTKRFPHIKPADEHNITVTTENIIELIKQAIKTERSIRIHERGDFGINNQPDANYIKAWNSALSQFETLPPIWFYTHFYHADIAALGKYAGVYAYASVHSTQDIEQAKSAGFTLFAYASKIRKKRGGSKDAPKYIELPQIGKTLVCPEQRLGRTKVTCTGTKNTTACKYCVKGKGNIVFLEH